MENSVKNQVLLKINLLFFKLKTYKKILIKFLQSNNNKYGLYTKRYFTVKHTVKTVYFLN